jgi:SAM-dependent methyltransferase
MPSSFLPTPPCLLCGNLEALIRSSLSAQDLLKCWAIDGHQFNPSITKPLLDEGVIHLYECCRCGFHFFHPKLAGNSDFYEHLHLGPKGYYAPDRPENERNTKFALERNYRNILDIGCGTGYALDTAKCHGLQTYGIELTPSVAAEAQRRGHTIFPVLLQDLDPKWEGSFDLISLNQLLEHVQNPVGLIKQCKRFLARQGAIAIAVPASTGILRFAPWTESDWPPHHLSRWRTRDFFHLARLTGLRVVKHGGDRLHGSFLQSVLLSHRERCEALGKSYRGFSPKEIRLLAWIYRKTGMKYFFHRGLSIYCYLSKD